MFLLNQLRFILKLFPLFLTFCFLLRSDSTHLSSHPHATTKNKIYIGHISIAEDVPETIRESLSIKLQSHLVEGFGESNNIISESDLDILFKEAEDLQKQGRDSREILSQIAEARDADEMIHGKVFKDFGQIKLLLNNLKQDPKSNDFYTKSIVDISFYESDFDFYIREAAIKILNPRYKIKNSESIATNSEKKSLPTLNLTKFSDLKLISIGTVDWGNFEGLLKWSDAVDICESKGMRLPTPEELRDMAHLKNHILREPCCVFWTSKSNKNDSDYAYYIDINDGYGNFYHKDIDVRVRCVKK